MFTVCVCNFFGKRKLVQKLLVKCWWNWLAICNGEKTTFSVSIFVVCRLFIDTSEIRANMFHYLELHCGSITKEYLDQFLSCSSQYLWYLIRNGSQTDNRWKYNSFGLLTSSQISLTTLTVFEAKKVIKSNETKITKLNGTWLWF